MIWLMIIWIIAVRNFGAKNTPLTKHRNLFPLLFLTYFELNAELGSVAGFRSSQVSPAETSQSRGNIKSARTACNLNVQCDLLHQAAKFSERNILHILS